MPRRLQRSRKKGWRKPENAVIVDRTSRWGNPFTAKGCRETGFQGTDYEIKMRCIEAFRAWLLHPDGHLNWSGPEAEKAKAFILENVHTLQGKDLLCFCEEGQPCHADVLLELANPAN